ncbi:uncharacterized protein ATNIH1004_010873 [Aspergillus tanneri]|uniref:ATPase inhibitor, mitochondrial n=1 Tax=Aspergillus tanneri TaxID=1220188 RepID=A0A5M9M9G6_9EURO|nr:uncharacterized protein ATNIH1004_010873 [Aspergillus tanneri]KAA8641934.1 hypothetical protein ATNIH1004_010873 [Aspergillus tanneri]
MSYLIEASRPFTRVRSNSSLTRQFSIAVPARKAGEIGSPKPRGFLAERDSFAQREAAQENMYIRSQEADKLRILKQKMAEQRRHLEELDRHLQELSREQAFAKN